MRRAPRLAARVRSAEAIETALIELDEGAKPKANYVATWQPVTPEHWRLERAPQRVARDRKGRPVPHFEEQFQRLTAMAKSIAPHEDAEGFALRLLDVDRRAIVQEAAQIDVTRRGDVYVATLRNGKLAARDIATAATLPEAMAAAQTRLQNGDLPVAAPRHTNGRRKKGAVRRFRGRRKRTSPPAA